MWYEAVFLLIWVCCLIISLHVSQFLYCKNSCLYLPFLCHLGCKTFFSQMLPFIITFSPHKVDSFLLVQSLHRSYFSINITPYSVTVTDVIQFCSVLLRWGNQTIWMYLDWSNGFIISFFFPLYSLSCNYQHPICLFDHYWALTGGVIIS